MSRRGFTWGGGSGATWGDKASANWGTHVVFAPVWVSLEQGNRGELVLTWDVTGEPDEINIYRADSSGTTIADYTQIDTVPSGTIEYTDTGLADANEYFYRLTSTLDGDESDISPEESEHTSLPQTNISDLTYEIEQQVRVEWNKVDNNDTGTWEVFRTQTKGDLGSKVTTVDHSSVEAVDDTVNFNEIYYYTLRRSVPE